MTGETKKRGRGRPPLGEDEKRATFKSVTLSEEVIGAVNACRAELLEKIGFEVSFSQAIRYLLKNQKEK